MPIRQNDLEQLIQLCEFKYDVQDEQTIILNFQTQSYTHNSGNKRLSIHLELLHQGQILKIFIPTAFQLKLGQDPSAILLTLSIISYHLPVISFGFDPQDLEIQLQADLLIADSQLTEQQLHQYIELLLKVCDSYYEEIQFVINNSRLHPRFQNESDDQEENTSEMFSRLKNYLDELQKLVNEVERAPSRSEPEQESESEDSNDDLEWL